MNPNGPTTNHACEVGAGSTNLTIRMYHQSRVE